ncbi:unnamed protein product, partial [Rotaria magnacalcarata]
MRDLIKASQNDVMLESR